ncbi:MAG: 4Fe-4S binding protein, partial [Nitrospirales bacterium]|nr:4Fe-4S binding protein [Nitrospirales bacterium]
MEDVDCFALAEQLGTPLYVTSESRLRENIRAYHRAFPNADKYFAVKANGNLTLLSIAAQEGMGADVFSAGELSVVRMAGMPRDMILYNGNSKSEKDHEMAIQAGVRMSVDSREELEHLAQTAQALGREAEILFRVNPDVSPNLCTPGGAGCAEAVALITGKKAESMEPIFSRIMCQGGSSKSVKRFIYEGVKDCRAATLAGGGDKSCIYGCLGYGTCMRACPFDAIHMSEDNLPVVDMTKCTGCRKCETACPKRVIEVLPGSKAVVVACHSKDKGGDTRKNCQVGCIACGKCVKVCPFDAPKVENNLSKIDLDKCRVCGLCVQHCPTKAIADFIPNRPKAFVTDKCIGCQICMKVCPVNAATGDLKQKHTIDSGRCIGCGICTSRCPVQAIDGTFNAAEVFAAVLKKKSVA